MADTQRTQADLLTRYADNTSRNISPQDGRDVISSVFGGYAEVYTHDGSGTQTISAASTDLITQVATNGDASDSTADQANNRIVIGVAAVYEIHIDISWTTNDADDAFTFYLLKNTVAVNGFKAAQRTIAADKLNHISMSGIESLAASDALTLAASHDGAGGTTSTLVVKQLRFWIKRIS